MSSFARHPLLPFALAAILLFLAVAVSGVGLKAPCKTCTCHGEDQSKYVAPTLTPLSRTPGTRSVAVWARNVACRGGLGVDASEPCKTCVWHGPRDMSDGA